MATFKRPVVFDMSLCKRAILLVLVCLVLVAAMNSDKPADYPYGQDAGRVFDLVQFFESLEDTDTFREKKPQPISLAEAAEKLHILAGGENMADMCSRYHILIGQANVRTLASVRELADAHITDYEHQPEANFLAKLATERKYDAIGRIYTIVSSLDSEKSADGTSAYGAPVQNDLLDCLEYLVYRHGVATDGLVNLIADGRSRIGLETGTKRQSLSMAKYQPLIDKVAEIERHHFSTPTGYDEWINGLTELQRMTLEDGLTIPRNVEEFLRDSQRLNTLKLLADMLSEASSLKRNLIDFEQGTTSADCQNLNDYVLLLDKLKARVEASQGKFPAHIVEFAVSPARQAFVDMAALKEYEMGVISKRCQNLNDYTFILERLTGQVDSGAETGPAVADFVHDPRRKMFVDMSDLEEYENGVSSKLWRDFNDYIDLLERLTIQVDSGAETSPRVADFVHDPRRQLFADMSALTNYEKGMTSKRCRDLKDYADILERLIGQVDSGSENSQSLADFVNDPRRTMLADKAALEDYEKGVSSERCQDLTDYIDILERLTGQVDSGVLAGLSVADFVQDPRRRMFIDKRTLEDYEQDIPSRDCGTLDDYVRILNRLNEGLEATGAAESDGIGEFAKDPARQAFVEKQKQLLEHKVPYVGEKPEKNALTKDVPLEEEEIGHCKEWLGDLCRIKGRTVDLNEVHRYVAIFNKLEDLCYNRYEDATKYVDRKRQLFYSFLNELRDWYNKEAPQYEANQSRITKADRDTLSKTKVLLDANQLREATLREQNILP